MDIKPTALTFFKEYISPFILTFLLEEYSIMYILIHIKTYPIIL
ncbi:hypothetical protein SEHO0A_01493 [Salmonella enterica subsp. houtenae str. ATCC BAA-1581]|nr:hypothetical protein SEHO0A_01493 [Salmonella enterica subsp. houtenae str. ATCC BAA-1581]